MSDDTEWDIEFEDDPIGCVFPGRCVMPGVHLESECATAEMMEDLAQAESERDNGDS